ncbi:hypothetical protein HDG35_006344 [Paraburkholderia sp. JPY681]|nr:hypothetical protein [Paraburkholderia atlantica]
MAACAGRRQTGASALADEVALELSQGAKQVKHESTTDRRGIDALLQAAQADAGGIEPLDQVNQVLQRPPEPVQPPDHDRIARAQRGK